MTESDRPISFRLWAALVGSIVFLLGTMVGLIVADGYDWAKDRLFPTKPVSIRLELDPAAWEAGYAPFGGESYEWVFPTSPPLLRPPPRGPCFRRYDWGKGSAGSVGTDARTTRFRLTIQSGGGQSVLLEKISPVVHRHLPSDEGTHVACPVGGATRNLAAAFERLRELPASMCQGSS